jgi:predicted AAA+ superfamily ATPase
MIINRSLENTILEYIKYFPCVGVVGARQVGKTTLVKSIQSKLQKPTQYIDLELPEDRLKLTEPSFYLSRFSEHLIIIDEIQQKPELFPILRSLIDQNREPGRFLLLGSASPIILSSSGESLAGRIIYSELNPLTIVEVGAENWEKHWLKGGFPDAYLMPEMPSWAWRNSFLNTYITRDLPQIGLNVSPIILDKLLLMLASIHGELLNESMISKSLGLSVATVGRYIDFLENSYFIRRLYGYHSNIRKRLVKSPKVYFRDSGLLHRILGVSQLPELYGNALAGNSFEGYAIQQIIANLNENVKPYFYRTADGSEMDLVLVKGIKAIVSIEIKLSNAPKLSRGNRISIEDIETPHNFLLTPTAGTYQLDEKIVVTDLNSILIQLRDLNLFL